MDFKEKFLEIYRNEIKREGAENLLKYLEKSDFFTAPSSTRYHGSHPEGLVKHSINVYESLCDYMDYLARPKIKDAYDISASRETIAIVALLHDLCKIDVYKPGFRNVKNDAGQWEKVPTYEFEDNLPYGHGEKSVYIISGFMKLTREEAFAIRYHMGFSGTEDARTVGNALRMYPLAFALSTSDMEATFLMESIEK